MERMIIDKPEIAREHVERMVGVRQDGDPHIPVGSRLREATMAPPRGEEYRSELYERALSMYDGSRKPNWTHPGGTRLTQDEPEEAAKTAQSQKGGGSILPALAIGVACFLVVVLLIQSRRNP